MKRNKFFYIASSVLVSAGLLASCGNKQQNENSQNENLKEEAEQEVFTPDEKTEAVDTLQQIEEMVKAVETPVEVNGINGTKYDAAFFDNAANKADKASADKYAQTATGLKYVIAKEGTGKSPKSTDVVTVHYVGTLTDGTVFDSSVARGESIDFPLNAVIPGWTEGLQLMKEGGEAVFFIPSNLAYGPRELPGIPANSTLMFWVQLIKVN